jgi:hypothetical protein
MAQPRLIGSCTTEAKGAPQTLHQSAARVRCGDFEVAISAGVWVAATVLKDILALYRIERRANKRLKLSHEQRGHYGHLYAKPILKLLTDGLHHYDTISAALHLTHLGCNQHARAYFYKARKVSTSKCARSLAQVAIDDYSKPIFAVEEEISTLRNDHVARGVSEPLDEIKALRQQKSKPIFEAFRAWIELLAPATPPESALGKAFTYCTNQWEKLVRHLEHPEVAAHNNYIEQQIKRYATGRKAWMFVYDKVGAEASANLFSLVMTARANDLDPFAYFCEVFEQLPLATSRESLEALLPWNVQATLQARAEAARAAIAISERSHHLTGLCAPRPPSMKRRAHPQDARLERPVRLSERRASCELLLKTTNPPAAR